MAILNYTTTIDAFKSVSEIEYILVQHKAKSIMKNYDNEKIVGLSFLIDNGISQIPVRIPAKTEECLKVLKKQKQENPKKRLLIHRSRRSAWHGGYLKIG